MSAIDFTPREIVNPLEDERVDYEQQDRDRLTELVGPGCDQLGDEEVQRLLGRGRNIAMRLLGEVA
jgi:hypothetical protein